MALPWRLQLRSIAGSVAVAALILGVGTLFYMLAPTDAKVLPIAGRIVGLGVDPASKSMMGTNPSVLIDFRLDDGRRWSRRVDADIASRCRADQRVSLGMVRTQAGGFNLNIPPDLCTRR